MNTQTHTHTGGEDQVGGTLPTTRTASTNELVEHNPAHGLTPPGAEVQARRQQTCTHKIMLQTRAQTQIQFEKTTQIIARTRAHALT